MGNWLEMTKRGSLALIIGLAFTGTLAAAPVLAQAPTLIKQNNAWGSYSYQGQNGKTCYILSMPDEKLPSDRDHGDVFFMLAQHPEGSNPEPQFHVGYPFKDNSRVILDIDGKQFSMFTQGDNAWLENPAEESVVVDSMRAGSEMSLSGESRRGTQTKYDFLLSGVTASLQDIQECR